MNSEFPKPSDMPATRSALLLEAAGTAETSFAATVSAHTFRTASSRAHSSRTHTNCSTIEGVRFL